MGAKIHRSKEDSWSLDRALVKGMMRVRETNRQVAVSLANGARVLDDAADLFRLARKEATATRTARKGGRV